MSWLRFVEFDENIVNLYHYKGAAISAAQKYKRNEDSDSDNDEPDGKFKAKDLPPISIKNEKKALERLYRHAKEIYDKYPTTIEEDDKILERDDLTFNLRNCVLYRHGEKKILIYLMEVVKKLLPLFDMNFKVRVFYCLLFLFRPQEKQQIVSQNMIQ